MNSPKLSLFISLILGFLVINVNDSSALNLSLNSVYHPDVFAELLDLEGLPNHGMAMTGVGGLWLFYL